jgi:hypothetical protein
MKSLSEMDYEDGSICVAVGMGELYQKEHSTVPHLYKMKMLQMGREQPRGRLR